MKKNVLLTFDYELFLGARTGTVKNCLIEPTRKLCDILDKYNAKGIFFIDTLSLIKIREILEMSKEYEQIIIQLKKLISDGHYVFPHIHPHWLDAKYLNNKQFDLSDLSKYSLASINLETVERIFNASMELLLSLGVNSNSLGYRAGGWCIQPFSNYKDLFVKKEIKYDFSVLPGYKNETKEQRFDFSSIDKILPYTFSNEVELPTAQGEFIEFPISTISISSNIKFFDKIIRKILWKTGDRGFGDGISARTASAKSNALDQEMISLDLLNVSKLKLYKSYINKNDYMHWISHPKMFTKHGLKSLDQFLKYSHSNYIVEYDFIKMI